MKLFYKLFSALSLGASVVIGLFRGGARMLKSVVIKARDSVSASYRALFSSRKAGGTFAAIKRVLNRTKGVTIPVITGTATFFVIRAFNRTVSNIESSEANKISATDRTYVNGSSGNVNDLIASLRALQVYGLLDPDARVDQRAAAMITKSVGEFHRLLATVNPDVAAVYVVADRTLGGSARLGIKPEIDLDSDYLITSIINSKDNGDLKSAVSNDVMGLIELDAMRVPLTIA